VAERLRGRTLPRSFYARDSRELGPLLLNKLLVRDDPDLGRLAVRLVEVEAYAGAEDPGSHGYRGPTDRNATMFGPAGFLYVYFTYGMHWCCNVVSGVKGASNAVLLRAGEPVLGVDAMRRHRPKARRDRDLCSGPARLTQALGIIGDDDGSDLVRGSIRLLDDGTPPPKRPGRSRRVGLREGRGDQHRWRYFVRGNINVSRGPSD